MPSKAYRDWMGFVGSNPLECLAGLPVEVIFRSFADLERSGIPKGVNAILNMGEAGTSWSGGDHWADPGVTTLIRRFVCRGGGFIGIGDSSACPRHGQCFQLADLLGVEKEIGNPMGVVAHRVPVVSNPKVDCAFYPKAGIFCLAKSVDSRQTTMVFDANGAMRRFTLQPHQWRWEKQSVG